MTSKALRTLTACLVATSLTLLALPAAPVHALAVAAGYVFADQPTTASYAATAGSAYNSSGGAIGIQRPAVGSYVVTFGGLGVAGGVAHVTAAGWDTQAFCTLVSSKAVAGDQVLRIRCYGPAGAVDAPFVANFTYRGETSAPFM